MFWNIYSCFWSAPKLLQSFSPLVTHRLWYLGINPRHDPIEFLISVLYAIILQKGALTTAITCHNFIHEDIICKYLTTGP